MNLFDYLLFCCNLIYCDNQIHIYSKCLPVSKPVRKMILVQSSTKYFVRKVRISIQVAMENYSWKVGIIQKIFVNIADFSEDLVQFRIFVNVADFSCVIFWAQNAPIPPIHILLRIQVLVKMFLDAPSHESRWKRFYRHI